ncbi:MAG: GNAT family N-acetyltransferase [Epsilonproteobacteria bacterium]|nr:GNAT family N-acetyltransferase [Campylobacterota bacterium]
MSQIDKIDEYDRILDLINGYSDAEIYHHPCWKKILEEVFGYNSLYLFCKDAFVPFMYQKSTIFSKKRAISLPIFTYGGIIGNFNKLSDFLDYIKKEGFEEATIKQFQSFLFEDTSNNSQAEYRKELINKEDIWKGLNKGKKSNVKSAEKKGFRIAFTKGKESNIDRFYTLYLRKMREFGTPPLPKKVFIELSECFKDKFNMFEIFNKNTLIGATICIGFKDIYYYIYAAYDTSLARKYKHAQVYMIYNMMLEALRHRYKHFSFGRSTKNSSQAKTKRYMGAKEININTYNVNLSNMNISSKIQKPKDFKLLIALWKKLPLKATELLGKPVRKFLS